MKNIVTKSVGGGVAVALALIFLVPIIAPAHVEQPSAVFETWAFIRSAEVGGGLTIYGDKNCITSGEAGRTALELFRENVHRRARSMEPPPNSWLYDSSQPCLKKRNIPYLVQHLASDDWQHCRQYVSMNYRVVEGNMVHLPEAVPDTSAAPPLSRNPLRWLGFAIDVITEPSAIREVCGTSP